MGRTVPKKDSVFVFSSLIQGYSRKKVIEMLRWTLTQLEVNADGGGEDGSNTNVFSMWNIRRKRLKK
jgi:hypothetical protein